MAYEPYTSSFNIQIFKYQLPGMADESHPDGGEFLYLLVEYGEVCSHQPLSSFRAAYSKLLELEKDRRAEADESGGSLFEDPIRLTDVLETPQFEGAVYVPYDGQAAEAKVLAELHAEVGNEVEENLSTQGNDDALNEGDAAPNVINVKRPKFP